MSGRARHWRDGKLITNRKTDRRQGPATERTDPDQMPEYVLRFMLPIAIGFAISEGPTGVIGVTVSRPGPTVEVRGKNLDWVLRQGAAYLGAIAGDREHIISGRITRDAYPGPTTDGPLRPPIRYACQLICVPGASIIVPRRLDPPMIFPVKR